MVTKGDGIGSVSRREALVLGGAGVGMAASAAGGVWVYRSRHAQFPLHSETVAYATAEQRVLVQDAELLEPDTRVLDGTTTDEPRRRMEAFIATARPWLARLPQRDRGLAHGALLDLWVLSDELPANVAGWSPGWHYIWPRDAAFVAVALARVGHLDLAVAHLVHLQHLQAADGWFEARYQPGTRTPPDDRARQFDGTGLVAWAAVEVGEVAARTGLSIGDRLDPVIRRSFDTLVRATDQGRSLPAASPDFWEVPERSCTVGIAACTLAGLEAGGRHLGQNEPGKRFTRVVESSFGATGFQRYQSSGGADAGMAFLDATGVHDLVTPARLREARKILTRPAGGLAPGSSWKDDGISWTPATSLFGLAMARAGLADDARAIALWIDDHRTKAGSIPEKVLHDGAPATEAPLAWSAANVLLILDAIGNPRGA